MKIYNNKRFISWLKSDNVHYGDDKLYSTQCSMWRPSFTIEQLADYFIKEYADEIEWDAEIKMGRQELIELVKWVYSMGQHNQMEVSFYNKWSGEIKSTDQHTLENVIKRVLKDVKLNVYKHGQINAT